MIEFLAPDAPVEGLMADEVDKIVLVRVDQVQPGKRLRALDNAHAEALGLLMRRDGQRKSIEICRLPGEKLWTLVDGAHRLAGAAMFDIEYLRAEIVTSDANDRSLREIDAQLWHRGLNDPVDRAAFMAKLVSLKRSAAGLDVADHRAAKVNNRWKQEISGEAAQMLETISTIYGFSEELGELLGLTGRTVRNDLMIYRRLAPSLIENLRDAIHPVAKNATQLRALAKLEESDQRRVVDLLVSQPDRLKSVSDALGVMHGRNAVADPGAKRLSAFIGAFARMSLGEKKGALSELRALLPAGFQLVEAGSAPIAAARGGQETSETISNVPTAAPVPAVAIRASVKAEYLVCLECGEKHMMLKRHLSTQHQLTQADYLAKWKLPVDYPMVAPNTSDQRRLAAKKLGLGGAK